MNSNFLALTKVQPQPKVEVLSMEETLTEIREERQVVIHCKFAANNVDMVRIWKTTYLHPIPAGPKIALEHAENITYAPLWTEIPTFQVYNFTLIFSGLPQGCVSFDLVEESEYTEDGGLPFVVIGIQRNESDVYTVWL